jgi:hypothetical protein
MQLPSSPTPTGLSWRLHRGEATWEPATGRWLRPGLDAPVLVRGDEVALAVTLDDEAVVAQLVTPRLVPALGTATLELAWPLTILATIDGRLFDRFRPGLRGTLLGDVGTGRVLPAVRAADAEEPVPPHHAALQVRLHNEAAVAKTVRRVAFEERALSLWAEGATLRAGVVDVRLFDDHAEAVVLRPSPAPGARTIRGGLEGSRSTALLGWVDSARRSLGFSLQDT